MINSDAALGRPWMSVLVGSTLWILDGSGDPWVHVVQPASGRLIRSLGRKGQGPGEFMAAFTISPAGSGGDAIWVFDPRLQRLTRLEASATGTRSGGIDPHTVRLTNAPAAQRAIALKGGRFVGLLGSDTARFLIASADGDRLSVVPGPLLGPDSIPILERLRASAGAQMCARPDGERFAVAYYSAGRIDLFDANAQFLRSAAVPFPFPPVFAPDTLTKKLVFHRPQAAYMDCSATNERIFALFSGRGTARAVGGTNTGSEFIHVFSWDGQLVRVLELDRPVRGIAVDPEGTLVYGVSDEDASITRFVVPS